jgi:acetylornithine deacetylase
MNEDGPTLMHLARDLMAIDSTSGRESEVITFADEVLRARGWNVTRIPVSPGRDCLYARGDADPVATLSTHLDTVPPYIPPRIEGDVLHGRGACDAKGIAAAMIVAAGRLRDRGAPVALLFVVGEETTHDGAHAANDWALRYLAPAARALINGEPTENRLAVGTKGAQRVIVRTSGRAAHSAYPELGHSATRDLVHLLAELDALELPGDGVLGDTTVNIGTLGGGVADNVIAPAAEARVMIRLVTPASEIIPVFERWARGRAALEWSVMAPPVRLHVFPGFDSTVVAFTTDIGALGAWGEPYLLGPGWVGVAHTPDERVRAGDLALAVQLYERLAEAAVLRAAEVSHQ